MMRKVRFLTIAAGPMGPFSPGHEAELPADVCAALVEGGYAVYVDKEAPEVSPAAAEAPQSEPEPEVAESGIKESEPAAVESASLEATEAAVQPRVKGRTRT